MSVEAWPDREFPIGREAGVIALDDSAMVGVCGRLWMISKGRIYRRTWLI